MLAILNKIHIVCIVVLLTTQCSPSYAVSFKQIKYNDLMSWKSDSHGEALEVYKLSCNKILAKSQDKKQLFHKKEIYGTTEDWQTMCKKALNVPQGNQLAKQFFEQNFTPYKVSTDSSAKGLFTGYIESTLRGSKHKDDRYQYPIYSYPTYLNKKDIPTREEIELGALKGKGLELLYVDSPISAFFLHIQGSGRVLMDDGTTVKLGYSGKNKYPYTSIGKVLIDTGEVDKESISAPKIKKWLAHNPSKAKEVMNKNKSYVFFKEIKAANPIGAQGVPLTPKRSLAIDKKYVPYGVPLWLETTLPNNQSFNRLMISQDTGAAIKGPIRGDIFFGHGHQAEHIAGHMKQSGSYAILLPNSKYKTIR